MNKKMRARKRRQARRVALTLCLMMAVALVSIGGTIAWLTDSTEDVKNTFTVGNINIDLYETENNEHVMAKELKMVPGKTLEKDPTVTVEAGSEACYVFVEITESVNLGDFISYTVDSTNWTIVPGETNVYYHVQPAIAENGTAAVYNVLVDNQVTVLEDVSKSDMDDLTTTTYPTLTFKAYAIQSTELTDADDNVVNTPEGAWALVSET